MVSFSRLVSVPLFSTSFLFGMARLMGYRLMGYSHTTADCRGFSEVVLLNIGVNIMPTGYTPPVLREVYIVFVKLKQINPSQAPTTILPSEAAVVNWTCN